MNGLTLRVNLRLFIRAGHESTYAYSENHNFLTKSDHCQSYSTTIGNIFRKENKLEIFNNILNFEKWILRSLMSLFLIFVNLSMTLSLKMWFSFTECICGFMANSHKNLEQFLINVIDSEAGSGNNKDIFQSVQFFTFRHWPWIQMDLPTLSRTFLNVHTSQIWAAKKLEDIVVVGWK